MYIVSLVTLLTVTWLKTEDLLLHFHCNNGYAKTPQAYVIPTVPILSYLPKRLLKVVVYKQWSAVRCMSVAVFRFVYNVTYGRCLDNRLHFLWISTFSKTAYA